MLFAYVNVTIAKQIAQKLCSPLIQPQWEDLRKKLEMVPAEEMKTIDYPWNLIEENPHMLSDEIPKAGRVEGKVEESVSILGEASQLTLLEGSVIEAGSVIDLREGPVWIGRNTEIQPLSSIKGPAFIG